MIKFPIKFIDIGLHTDLDVWTDCHKRSDMAIPFKPLRTENTILMGDNIDVSREKKSKVNNAREEESVLVDLYGNSYFTGNHSRAKDVDDYRPINHFRHIACGHGDSIFKGFEWSHEYRNGEAGAGFLKRKIWTNFLEGVQQNWGGSLDNAELENAYQIAKYIGSRVLLIGHGHPVDHLQYDYKNIHVECFQRGRTPSFDLMQFEKFRTKDGF